jgi:uncharacterized metal-binding protein (TIGR02443 family)
MTKNFIRFIAGAACPKCKELDKIAITPDDKTIYCLSCDFEEHRPQGSIGNNKKSDLPGLFNIEDFRLKKS